MLIILVFDHSIINIMIFINDIQLMNNIIDKHNYFIINEQ